MRRAVAALSFLLISTSLFAAEGLRIVSAGPVGETATLTEANEIRAVFSEPMVVLGRIPNPVTAPFFKIAPAVKGTFRWSGTTTLIFTPDALLPYATEYTVTIDKSAKSVAGKTLDQPYRWTFTTPTIRLLRADWYRKDNGAVVIGMRFNQSVDAQTLVPHLKLQTQAHTIELPPIPAAGEAKKQKALAAAASDAQPILSFIATNWNKERFVPGKDLVVLETKPGVPPDTNIQILIDDKLAPSPRSVRGQEQAYTLELEPTLFVKGMDCESECDPEQRNAINFRSGSGVMFAEVQKAVSVSDVTDPAKPVAVKPKKVESEYDYPSWGYGLDELGYTIQPGRKYAVKVAASLKAFDGQQLGYDWTAAPSPLDEGRRLSMDIPLEWPSPRLRGEGAEGG